MKKTVLLSFSLLFFSSFFAGKSELFQINETELEKEFSAINELEEFVDNNAETTYTHLVREQNKLMANITFNTTSSFNSGAAFSSISDMDWGAFAWGFLCCPVGFFVVAINGNKDSDQKVSYWIGVGVSTLFSLLYSAVVTTASSGI